jgi:hypothetical protein
MRSFREQVREARRDLHAHMAVDALYVLPVSDLEAEVTPCTVRVHEKRLPIGDQLGTSFQYAERHEVVPEIILLRSQIPAPVRGAIFSIAENVAYKIDNVMPADEETMTVQVTRMTRANDLAGLPIPGVWEPTP